MIEYEIFIILVIELDKIIILSLANVNCVSLMSIFKQKIDELKKVWMNITQKYQNLIFLMRITEILLKIEKKKKNLI